MTYRVPVGDGTFCYTPNCSRHFREWEQAVPAVDDRAELMRDLGLREETFGLRREVPRQSAAEIVNDIPEQDRVKLDPAQIEAIFEVMQQFGTFKDDAYGFRSYIAKKDFIHEWSERGADIRYFQRVREDGTVSEINLYRISGSSADEAKIYRGQAAIRHIAGLEEYTLREREQIAEEYWNSNILPDLGNLPAQGTHHLRSQYIREIAERQPNLIPEILDEWEKSPQHRIKNTVGSARTYIETVVPADSPYNKNVQSELLAALDSGDKKQFNKVLRSHSGYLPRRSRPALSGWATRISNAAFAEAAAQNA